MANNYRNVVFIGDSGMGKSTLINQLGNYFLRGTFYPVAPQPWTKDWFLKTVLDPLEMQDNIKYIIATKDHKQVEKGYEHMSEEVNSDNQMLSQTKHCKSCQFKKTIDNIDYVFQVFDSPGLNDTGGIDQDNTNCKTILEALSKEQHFSAICLVVNGTDVRQGDTIRHSLVRLRNMLPNCLLERVYLFLTKCDEKKCCFQVASIAAYGINPHQVYKVNNSVFGCNMSKLTDSEKLELKRDWDASMATLDQFCRDVAVKKPVEVANVFAEILQCTEQKFALIDSLLINYESFLAALDSDPEKTTLRGSIDADLTALRGEEDKLRRHSSRCSFYEEIEALRAVAERHAEGCENLDVKTKEQERIVCMTQLLSYLKPAK